jgi:hypothetical protein
MTAKMRTLVEKEEIIHYTIILFGVSFSLIQFFYNRSLWLDEAMLANNIIERNFWELTKPLDYAQVAPILFLQIVKLFATLIPNSEFGLRLFPLLCYWASLFFFYKLSKLILKRHSAITLSITLFIFNYILIYYSSELKQYMADVFVCLVLFYFSIKKSNSIEKDYLLFIILGSTLVFLSNITPIILLSCGIYLVYNNLSYPLKRGSLKILSFIFSSWFISFLIYFTFFIYNHPTKNAMLSYWQNENAFLPINPLNANFYDFLLAKMKMIFYTLLNLKKMGGIVFFILYLIGAISLGYKKNFGLGLFVFFPIMVHLLLSAVKLYPFDLRLILYLAPFFILTISIGFDNLLGYASNIFKNKNIHLLGFLPSFFFIIYFFYKSSFPIENEEIKKAFRYIGHYVKPQDQIYIYYSAIPAFKYYKSINHFSPGNPLVFGVTPDSDKSNFIDQIKNMQGRTWFLFSHPFNNDDKFLIQQMDSLGFHQLQTLRTYGASVFLYQMDKPIASGNF